VEPDLDARHDEEAGRDREGQPMRGSGALTMLLVGLWDVARQGNASIGHAQDAVTLRSSALVCVDSCPWSRTRKQQTPLL
jgi:hypothetical protein